MTPMQLYNFFVGNWVNVQVELSKPKRSGYMTNDKIDLDLIDLFRGTPGKTQFLLFWTFTKQITCLANAKAAAPTAHQQRQLGKFG